MTEGEAAGMRFLRRVAGLVLHHRKIWKDLRKDLLLLHIERSQLSWFKNLMQIPTSHMGMSC